MKKHDEVFETGENLSTAKESVFFQKHKISFDLTAIVHLNENHSKLLL